MRKQTFFERLKSFLDPTLKPINSTLGLKKFFEREDFQPVPADELIKANAGSLQSRMSVPLSYQWEPVPEKQKPKKSKLRVVAK